MIRHAAAVVLAITLTPALVHAQETVLTVTAPSAEVYKAPSNVTPVVGRASQGTVLPVSRNLGSWVKVAWPSAPDGVGYVHVTMGRLGPAAGAAAATATAARPAVSASPATAKTAAPPARMPATHGAAARRRVNLTPESHILGVGGLIGSMSSVGATARAWRDDRFGVQLGITRDAMTSEAAAGRVTSMQFEPAVVYALADRVSDYVWLRPYVGAGLSFRHQTFTLAPGALETTSSNGIGLRGFGGTELTFASVPRFGVSVELGYRRLPTPFPGFDPDRVNMSIAGHWYIK
jgi:hypothetical protein